MASPTGWTWIWASSRSWWWTGKPGVLQSMGHKELDMTELLNWTEEPWSEHSRTPVKDIVPFYSGHRALSAGPASVTNPVILMGSPSCACCRKLWFQQRANHVILFPSLSNVVRGHVIWSFCTNLWTLLNFLLLTAIQFKFFSSL